jgi:hypothetical protein
MTFICYGEIEIGQPIEPSRRRLDGHDQDGSIMIAIETGADDPMRDPSPGELGRGLVNQLTAMNEDSDAASLADHPADDVAEDHSLAGASRRDVADRPSALVEGRSELLNVSDLIGAKVERYVATHLTAAT